MIESIQNIPQNIFLSIGVGVFLFIILYKFFPSLFLKIHKPIFFTIGILSLSLGYVGILLLLERAVLLDDLRSFMDAYRHKSRPIGKGVFPG